MLKRLQHARAFDRNRLKIRQFPRIQIGVQIVNRKHIFHIAFVIFIHHRQAGKQDIIAAFQIVLKVFKTDGIGLAARPLRIRHEHNRINPLQHGFAGVVIFYLPRHGIDLKAQFEIIDLADIERQKLEINGLVGFGRQKIEFPFAVGNGLLMQNLQGRGFAA